MAEGGMISIDVELTLRNDLARRLITEAEKRNLAPAVLFADIVETVLNDDLIGAILDV